MSAPALLALQAVMDGAAAPVALAKVADGVSASNLDEYTFSSKSFGDAAAGRKLLCLVGGTAGGEPDITGLTIGGQAAGKLVDGSYFDGGQTELCELWGVALAAGTSGDVVVSADTTLLHCQIALYRMVGADLTPYDTAIDGHAASTAALSLNLNVPENGAALAYAFSYGGSTPSHSFVGLTEAYDSEAESPAGGAAGSDLFAAAASPQTVTITPSVSAICAGLSASWGPG